jgi:hypothetical protein
MNGRRCVVPRVVSLVTCGLLALQPALASGSCPPPAVPVCPPGAAYNSAADRCQSDSHPCLAGYAYDTSTNECEVWGPPASSQSCPTGSSFNTLLGKCETANLGPCASGYSYNSATNWCEIAATFTPASSCPDGYTFDAAANQCVGAPGSACAQGGGTWGYYEQTCCSGGSLPKFTWYDELGEYVGPWACPPGYSVNLFNGACSGPMATASCPVGSTINAATSKCEVAAGPACAAGQTYNMSNAKCDFAPVVSAVPATCPPGYILNADTRVCAGFINSACPAGSSYGYYEQACTSGSPLPGFFWDDETGMYIGAWSCPPGFGLNVPTGSCSGTACQDGKVYNPVTSACETPTPLPPSTRRCPHGSGFNPHFGKCQAPNRGPCANGHGFNASSNRCEIAATFAAASSCPAGYTFDTVANTCVGAASSACAQSGGSWGYYEQTCTSGGPLPGFNLDAETGLYVGPWACPPAYSVNPWNGSCSGPMVTASCPPGDAINAHTSKCESAAATACDVGQTYNSNNAKCDFDPPVSSVAPTCPPGYILNADTQVCAGGMNSACPPGASYGYYEQACTSGSPLPGFNWDTETGLYVGPWFCPPGFTLDISSGNCSGAACPPGYAFDAGTYSCQLSGCPAGTVKSDDLCIAPPVCQ